MTAVITHSVSAGGTVDATADVDGAAWDANHVITGVMSPSQGGTGVANSDSSTITISGAFGTTFTVTATTSVTLPTTGTLATTSNKLSAFAATASAELAGVISDETGTGALVFANSPTLVTPALGTPASGVLTNATGLPLSTGISGLGTGIATALAVNTGSAGAPVLFNGALGTPSSGTLTNATGLPLSGLATQAAYTLVGNNTGSSAVPTAVDISAVTLKATPAATDLVLISDQAATGAWKRVTVSSLASASGVASIDTLTGAFTTDDSVSATSNVIRAQFMGQIYGLTLSNGTDATNDIDIATGEAAESSAGILMKLASGLTKQLDAAWAVGTAAGGLDTGSIANTTYHVFLIQRSDTGVVDALFSTSATAPTMPANYDRKRRIGSIVRASAAIKLFWQDGDVFQWQDDALDRNDPTAAAWGLLTLTVPTGLKLQPLLTVFTQQNAAGDSFAEVGDGRDSAHTSPVGMGEVKAAGQASYNYLSGTIFTDTSARIYFAFTISSGTVSNSVIQTRGWIDTRGKT